MATLEIRFGRNVSDNNIDVPFYVDVRQGGASVMTAFSTEGNKSTGIVKTNNSFDATQTTTIVIYNLGKKTNIVTANLINVVNGSEIFGTSSVYLANDGQKFERVVNIPAGSFVGYLNIICHEAYSILSGVNYVGNGTQSAGLYPLVISTKDGDSGFVGVTTPNNSLNPNYVSPTTLNAPTVSQTTIQDTQSLTVGGMQNGDLLHFFLDGVDQFPSGQSISSTGQLIIPMTGWGGLTAYFNYVRGSVTSPNSSTVTIVNDASVLDRKSVV